VNLIYKCSATTLIEGQAVAGFVLLNHSKMRSTYEALPSTHLGAKGRKDYSKKVAPAQQT